MPPPADIPVHPFTDAVESIQLFAGLSQRKNNSTVSFFWQISIDSGARRDSGARFAARMDRKKPGMTRLSTFLIVGRNERLRSPFRHSDCACAV